jgi:hypothetical protein
MTKSVNIARTIITTLLTLSRLCRLLLVRMDVYIMTLSDFYSYRIIGKLTVFFSFRSSVSEIKLGSYVLSLSPRDCPESAQVKMWTATRKDCCFTCYPQSRWRTYRISFSHSPITFTNISVINLVSIFRCSSSKTNSVYARRVNSLVLGCQ